MPAVTISRSRWLAVTLACVTASAHAEPSAITEDELARRIVATDPRFAVIAAQVDAQRAAITDARVRPNPSLSASREETFASGRGFPDNLLLLDWPLDISGRRGRRIAAAAAGVEAAVADASYDQLLLLLDALVAYDDARYGRARVVTLEDARAQLGKLVDVVRTRRRAGDVSGYDVDRLELELAGYDDAIIDAQIELSVARRRLATHAGQPGGSLDAAEALALPVPPTGDTPITARGDYRAAMLRARQAEAEIAAAKRAWVPTPVVSAGLKTTDTGVATATGYVIGLGFDLPLFDRGGGARERGGARRRQAQAELAAIDRDARGAATTAAEELTRRIDQAKRHVETQLVRLPEILRRAETAYREGDRPIYELLDAYRTARDVRLRQLAIVRDARTAQIALWRARGHR